MEVLLASCSKGWVDRSVTLHKRRIMWLIKTRVSGFSNAALAIMSEIDSESQ